MEIKIRQELEADYEKIYQVVKSAFDKAEHTNGDEQNLVNRLRNSHTFVPQLSLVAERNGEIVGHILFTKAKVSGTTQLVLAPLSVIPALQSCGIGGKLIAEGHRIARELGYEFSVLFGHAHYYPRFGYVSASLFGIQTDIEVPDENFMAINLQGKDTKLNGMLQVADEFGN